MCHYIEMFKYYARFTGRTTRHSFWLALLLHSIVTSLLLMVGIVAMQGEVLIATLYTLAAFSPLCALIVRRLHDAGKPGVWLAILLLPGIGVVWLIVLLCQPSTQGHNRYGTSFFE